MLQKKRSQREQSRVGQDPEPAAPPPPEPAPSTTPRTVEVSWGLASEHVDLQGMSIAEAFQLVQPAFNLAPDAVGVVNGSPVSAEYRLAAGDRLEFVRLAGHKGGMACR